MIPLQIPQKLHLVLYVWSDSESEREEYEVIGGLTYDYRISQVIGDGLLFYTLLCDYRYSFGDFQMMATMDVVNINR